MTWEIIVIFFTSSVKFLFAPIASLKLGFSIPETIVITIGGGAFGVCTFYYLSERLMQAALARKRRIIAAGKISKSKNFTRANKTILKVKRSFGVLGIAFLTLPFISVPLCAIIAAKFFRHQKNTIVYLLCSVVVWSVILTYLYSFI